MHTRFKGTPISKEDVLRAMRATRSNLAAAHFIGCSFQYYRQFAKLYIDKETGKSLFELHKNQSGKGIPKAHAGKGKGLNIQDIINGTVSPDHYEPNLLKRKMIVEGYLEEKCCHCGFMEHRVTDYKVPLLIYFKDNNKRNWNPLNLELYCYNCYFLQIGDVFSFKQIRGLEEHIQTKKKKIDWDVDDYVYKTVIQEKPDNSGEEFISRV